MSSWEAEGTSLKPLISLKEFRELLGGQCGYQGVSKEEGSKNEWKEWKPYNYMEKNHVLRCKPLLGLQLLLWMRESLKHYGIQTEKWYGLTYIY